MNNVASVKDRLNNVRRKTGKTMEQLLEQRKVAI